MKILQIIIFGGIMLGLFHIGMAQKNYLVQSHSIGAEDGLLGNYPVCVFQDSRSVIWVGTYSGLNSYDGIEIEAYTELKDRLAGDYIWTINEDVHQHIWVLCYGHLGDKEAQGINVINPLTQQVFLLEDYVKDLGGLNPKEVSTFEKASDGTIFLFTHSNEIYTYNKQGIQQVASNFLNEEYSKLSSSNLDLGIVARVNLQRHPITAIELYDFINNKVIEQFEFPFPVARLFFYKDTTTSAYRYIISWIDNDIVYCGFYDKNGKDSIQLMKQLIINDNGEGVFDVKEDRVYVSNSDSLFILNLDGVVQEAISANIEQYRFKCRGNKGGAWYQQNKPERLTYARYKPSLFKTQSFYNENGTRIGTRGITIYKDSLIEFGAGQEVDGTYKLNGKPMQFRENYTVGMYNDNDEYLYVGKESPSITAFHYATKTTKKYYFSENKGLIWAIYKDYEGKTWVGCSNGLGYIDTLKDSLVACSINKGYEELGKSAVYHIYEKGKLLWLCTSSGLYVWDKQKGGTLRYHRNSKEHYIPHNIILHLHEDTDGNFWLATKGGGLIFLDLKTGATKQFTKEQGLADNVLYAVYGDAYDNLWMSSSVGIACFNKKTKDVATYNKRNGLVDEELNTISHYQDKHGAIYFGGQYGIVTFHPDDFQTQKEHFPLQLRNVTLLSRSKNQSKNITAEVLDKHHIDLPTDYAGFKIKAALLDYSDPSKHEYAYYIEGIDDEWHYQSTPIIEEKSLPYGTYVIRIKIKGYEGHWQYYEHPIQLVVLRPFYLQTWFLILAFFIVLAAVVGILRLRTQQLRRRQKELEEIVKKRTAKIAQQAEDLRALDQLKSRFFANISHELRTPLTLILGPVSATLGQFRKGRAKEQEVVQNLNTIKNNGEHLLNLIEEILDLSKLESNKLEVETEQVQLLAFCTWIFKAFEKQAEYQGITYFMESNINENLHVLLDANKVEKMLNNLLSNALKFTPTGKQINFITRDLDDKIEFVVHDTGKGIHADDLPHIFERFYQSKQPNRPAQGGTGIGLALVQEFATLMDGTVQVESALNQGSTFTLHLPKEVVTVSKETQTETTFLSQGAMPVDAESLEETTPVFASSKTILLVEDHAEMRDFVASLLGSDYTILVATNGLEGLAQLEKNATTIDLIISDVMMPEMDGFTMLQEIKANSVWRTIPMIMLTARSAEQDRLNALTVGVDDYLTKPFSVEELKARVANLLQNAEDRKRWIIEEQAAIAESKKKEETTEVVEEFKEEQESIGVVNEEDLEWIRVLEENIKAQLQEEEISIKELAKQMFVSERHLRRRLKNITGLSPIKMVREIRMKIARTYLETGEFNSITDVAFSVGFQSSSAFSRAFKQHFGKVPKEYIMKRS